MRPCRRLFPRRSRIKRVQSAVPAIYRRRPFVYNEDKEKKPASRPPIGEREEKAMKKTVYKVDSFKVTWSTCRVFAEQLENFINEHAAMGWKFEGVEDHAFCGEWCCVIFSKEEEE